MSRGREGNRGHRGRRGHQRAQQAQEAQGHLSEDLELLVGRFVRRLAPEVVLAQDGERHWAGVDKTLDERRQSHPVGQTLGLGPLSGRAQSW